MLKKLQLMLLGDGSSPEPALATGPALAGGLQPCVYSGVGRQTAGWGVLGAETICMEGLVFPLDQSQQNSATLH